MKQLMRELSMGVCMLIATQSCKKFTVVHISEGSRVPHSTDRVIDLHVL